MGTQVMTGDGAVGSGTLGYNFRAEVHKDCTSLLIEPRHSLSRVQIQ